MNEFKPELHIRMSSSPDYTAAWKYYPTILLPATLMGFPWRREKSDSRQKYRSQRRQ